VPRQHDAVVGVSSRQLREPLVVQRSEARGGLGDAAMTARAEATHVRIRRLEVEVGHAVGERQGAAHDQKDGLRAVVHRDVMGWHEAVLLGARGQPLHVHERAKIESRVRHERGPTRV
jgi:hypothetical protein